MSTGMARSLDKMLVTLCHRLKHNLTYIEIIYFFFIKSWSFCSKHCGRIRLHPTRERRKKVQQTCTFSVIAYGKWRKVRVAEVRKYKIVSSIWWAKYITAISWRLIFLYVCVFTQANARGSHAAGAFLLFVTLINGYLPKWRWLLVDIYRAAKRRDKYPALTTDTVMNRCFSKY